MCFLRKKIRELNLSFREHGVPIIGVSFQDVEFEVYIVSVLFAPPRLVCNTRLRCFDAACADILRRDFKRPVAADDVRLDA